LFRLVIGLTVLSNVEKREVEMGVEAEPQKLSGEEIIEWSKQGTCVISPHPFLGNT